MRSRFKKNGYLIVASSKPNGAAFIFSERSAIDFQ